MFNFFSALGDVAFAFAGHNVVLEIQATIPSTPDKPSKKPMWKGVMLAYLVVALCYFPVALIGYWVFGNSVQDNILISLEKPKWLIVIANAFVVIHVIGSYQVQFLLQYLLYCINSCFSIHVAHHDLLAYIMQVFAMPVFDTIESALVKQMKFKPSYSLRFISRNIFVGNYHFLPHLSTKLVNLYLELTSHIIHELHMI